MINESLLDTVYKLPRLTIASFRKKGKDWDSILYGNKNDDEGLAQFIKSSCEDHDWDITVDEWKELVLLMKHIEEHSYVGFIGDPQKPTLETPDDESTAWMKYKDKLVHKAFTPLSIDNIETASKKVVSQLDSITDQAHPVRGMVVGNVQSGKTANMAGVIALAADYSYNFFIVLTGTIENLRKQTQERLISDLDNPNCNVNFVSLPSLSAKTPFPSRLSDLSLEPNSNKRYIYVCLKNSGRLNDLLRWINADKAKKSQLKILLLDDEADSAGINTANMSAKLIAKINNQIKALVFGRNHLFNSAGRYKCMNYIGYTATPYANFLNEANEEALYPTNFILTLNPSEEYIGPQQIFGIDDVNIGLPIVNEIPKDECEYILKELGDEQDPIPEELQKSILWFICTVSVFRYWNLQKPVSMLVHTSQKTPMHSTIASVIENYINYLSEYEHSIDLIKQVWVEQTSKLDVERFLQEMPDFPDPSTIQSYPMFEEIEPFVCELIGIGVQHILLDDEESKLIYGKGIHLCIDNCKNNKIEENTVMRLIYPDKNDKDALAISPAFLVVGGSTLSRGLTLEGLTTSYFLRSTILGDTLMQMGRWFGFRRHYELLPRIWLSKSAIDKFEHLTILDFDLREELHNMETMNISPKLYGPRLDSFPDFKELQVTSKNKRQMSYEIVEDFANKKGQTTLFYGDDEIIKNNYDNTISFINELGAVDHERIAQLNNPFASSESLIWFDVPYSNVVDLIYKLQYPEQKATFGDKNNIIAWFNDQFSKGYLNNFNVVVSSNKQESESELKLDNITINLPSRRKLKNADPDDTRINLKILTTPNDRLMDIDMSQFDNQQKELILHDANLKSVEKRIKFGATNTPLLILYVIDKNSGHDKGETKDREPLNLKDHLAGYYIYIPYGNNGETKEVGKNKLTVKLEFKDEEDVEDDETTN